MEDRTARFRIGQLADRTGVPRELLRKWEARYGLLEPERSPGGFRVYSLDDEQRVRLMQRHLGRGYAAAEAAELAKQGIVSPAPTRLAAALPAAVVERSHRLLRAAVHYFDEGAAQRALDDLFKAFTAEAVLRDALLPFLAWLGEAWRGGEATAAQEHFASTIIEARLMSMARGWGSGRGRRALLACPSGERHNLGLIAFGIALSRQGWRITYLGADTPTPSLQHAAGQVGPTLIVLAAVDSRRFTDRFDELAELASEWRVCIAGAGAGEEIAEQLGVDCMTHDPVTAALRLADEEPDREVLAVG